MKFKKLFEERYVDPLTHEILTGHGIHNGGAWGSFQYLSPTMWGSEPETHAPHEHAKAVINSLPQAGWKLTGHERPIHAFGRGRESWHYSHPEHEGKKLSVHHVFWDEKDADEANGEVPDHGGFVHAALEHDPHA